MKGVRIVATCDKEELMARQLCERYGAENYYSDLDEMLEKAKPDIAHITTPPSAHFEIGKRCIAAGCHTFFEKPFTLNTEQASKLIELTEKNNRKLTVGHNNQFTHAMMRMRKIVSDGFLGGEPVHLESIWCYDLGDPRFAKAFLNDKNHWVRSLPGQLAHNNISHGISKIAEFLKGIDPSVISNSFTSRFLRDIGEYELRDEIRVIINDGDDITAYFTFSTQMGPRIQQFRIHGPKNSLIVDELHQSVVKVSRTNYKSYLNHFIPPLVYSKEYAANSVHNVFSFITQNLHFDSGRKYLIDNFYRSIREDSPLPIPYREIIVTSKIMDQIFSQ